MNRLSTHCRLIESSNTLTWFANNTELPLLKGTSKTCVQDLAALVQIASDGKERGDGLRGEGMKGRWTAICR